MNYLMVKVIVWVNIIYYQIIDIWYFLNKALNLSSANKT